MRRNVLKIRVKPNKLKSELGLFKCNVNSNKINAPYCDGEYVLRTWQEVNKELVVCQAGNKR